MKNSFVFYTEWIEQIRILEERGTPEDREAFWSSLQAQVEGGDLPDTTTMAQVVLIPIRNQIARDTAKYEETSRKNSENGKKGAAAKKAKREEATASEDKRPQAKTSIDDDEDDDVDVSTNVDDIHTVSERELRDEFELIWAKYPRKVGKKDAFRHYKAARKKGAVFDEVYNGVMKYADAMAAEDEQYIAQGSTWFNGHRWEDEDVHARARPQKHLTMAEISSLPIIDPFAELRGAT